MLSSLLVHQDVLAIEVLEDSILSCSGGSIFIHSDGKLVHTKQIFHGQQIHNITSSQLKKFFVTGGKYVAFCKFSNSEIEVVQSWKCNDWVLDVLELNNSELVIVTAHNQAEIWNTEKGLLIHESAPLDRCILYSSKLWKTSSGELIVLAGTVYSDVVLWKPNFQSSSVPDILCRLTGHNGVIFSINIREKSSNQYTICTTSDDRSLRIWNVQGPLETAKVSNPTPLYGHTARVWRSLMLENHIITIGEDSTICLWTYSGDLRSKHSLHSGGIRGISFCTKTKSLLTGGGDGGLMSTPMSMFDEFSTKLVVCLPLQPKEIPRKVVFSNYFGAVYITDHGNLLCSEKGQTLASSEFFKQCTGLETLSSGQIVVMCNRISVVFIVNKDESVVKLGVAIKPCKTMLLQGNYLLFHDVTGVIVLKEITKAVDLVSIGSFQLPKGKDPTCFVYSPNGGLLIGDRLGGLHYYSSLTCSVFSLKKVHSCLGVSDIFACNDGRIFSAGAGGWIRELKIISSTDKNSTEDVIKIVHSRRVPLENVTKIIETPIGTLALGFHGSYFQIWDINFRHLLGSYNCGGGHRSVCFQLRQKRLDFLFIKDKEVKQITFNLTTPAVLRNSFHGKIINSLELVNSNVFVSGSDDNALRLWKIENGDISTLSIGEQHISSVRAISVVKISDVEYLIVSAGGREQLVVSSYNANTSELQDKSSYFSSNTPAEGRYMCLATELLNQTSVLIIVGCSDCTIRLFMYEIHSELKELGRLPYSCCILQVATIREDNNLCVASFGTNGKVAFWDISDVQENNPVSCLSSAELKLHASGINSIALRSWDKGGYLLATGGDDNKLSIVVLRKESSWSLVSNWSSSCLHSCQITGILFHEDLVITASIDQRLVLSKIIYNTDGPSLTILQEIISTVPDIHGITMFKKEDSLFTILYGKGMEIVQIGNDEFREKIL